MRSVPQVRDRSLGAHLTNRSQPPHQHWPAQNDFQKIAGGRDLFCRTTHRGITIHFDEHGTIFDLHLKLRLGPIPQIASIGQAQHTRQ